MQMKYLLTAGAVVTLCWTFAQPRGEASGGLFSRHHGDCDAHTNTVKLPAQNIRIETSRPRVIVQDVSGPRLRHQTFVPVAPFVQAQPIVATFLAPQGFTAEPRSVTGSSALSAAHALELQALEVAKARAAHLAEMTALERTHQRIMANLNASANATASPVTSDLGKLTAEIEKLSQRISDIERLLIIHDNILKEREKIEKGK